MAKGTLYLLPAPLAEGSVESVLPEGTLLIIRRLEFFIVEELRTARRFLIKAGIQKQIDELNFQVFNEHSNHQDVQDYLAAAMNGHDVGLLSEAGVPCVADPGSVIVGVAHENGIRVVPLTGPSSILLALMASGFNGQNFAFQGYLPAEKVMREKKIKELEKMIIEKGQTQIFIETPYRNQQVFESLVKVCKPDTLLCIATSISGAHETIKSQPIADWYGKKPDIHKKPTIFLLDRS
ncbi:MAG: SAM-dependent methyltransferase [Bacteroidetes bacterium]|nr:SAM-dependent methyltransferase [Bacteroidota bacterium]